MKKYFERYYNNHRSHFIYTLLLSCVCFVVANAFLGFHLLTQGIALTLFISLMIVYPLTKGIVKDFYNYYVYEKQVH